MGNTAFTHSHFVRTTFGHPINSFHFHGCWNCGFHHGFGWWGWGWGWGWWNPWWWWGPSWGWSWGWNDPRWGSSSNWSNPGYSNNGYNAYNNSSAYDSGYSANTSNDNYQYQTTPQTEGTANTNAVTGNVAASTPTVLIYQKDGTMYAASDYWIAGGKLHYLVNYGGESTVEMDQVDWQRTVDENAKRGVQFTLKPNPSEK
jgi:hypothetical protein